MAWTIRDCRGSSRKTAISIVRTVLQSRIWYLSDHWLGTISHTTDAADANVDGKVDLADLAFLAAHWLQE
jgi:hypothetical protein